jgi:gliding motility-associated-like protein
LIYYTISLAQPACVDNPSAADYCTDATPICNLNGYCGNTSGSYTNHVSSLNQDNETNTPLGNVFCATIQNNSWVKFVANSTTAVFNVWVSNCSINKGIQMRIYSTTDCYNFTPVSNCWNPQIPTNGQITATGLVAGQVYFFMIDGANGDICDYIIAASSGVSTVPDISPSKHICIGQTTSLTATGGDEYLWTSIPYDPLLSSQNTNSTITVNPSVTTTYTVTVLKDGNNTFCTDVNYTLSSVITVNPMPAINIIPSFEHCNTADGTLSVQITNSSGAYNYLWNTSPVQNTQTAENLVAGTYSVTVSDSYGCSSTALATVSNVNYETPVIVTATALCLGGTAVLDAGSGYLSYSWSTGSSNQTISTIIGGLFSVTVTGDNNCVGSDSTWINVIQPTPNIVGNPFLCLLDSTSLEISNHFVSYLWSTGSTEDSITVNEAQTYSITVTDNWGCSGSSEILVWNNDGPYSSLTATNEMCDQSNGSARIVATGGQGIYAYSWDNNTTDTIANGLSAGYHFVTVSDGNCQTIDSVIVYETEGPFADFLIYEDLLVLLEESVKAEFTDNTTGDIINWYWYFGDGGYEEYQTQASHYYENSGIYDITHIVEDRNGCLDTVVRSIRIKDYFTVYIPNCFVPYGDGINTSFFPIGQGWDSEDFEMFIYDRWGSVVFYSNDITNNKWNGTYNNTGKLEDMTDGVYVYLIRIKEEDYLVHEYRGTVTLLK